MTGCYRIWSKIPNTRRKKTKGVYFQSRFIIYPDYSSTLETVYKEPEDKLQPCWLWMADGKDGKILSVTSYQNRGIQIRNHALIKIEEEKKERFFERTI